MGHLKAGLIREKKLTFFLFPLFFGFIHAAARHHDMDMRVIIQATVMSMQDRGHADVGAEFFGIYAKVFQRAGNARKEDCRRGFGDPICFHGDGKMPPP